MFAGIINDRNKRIKPNIFVMRDWKWNLKWVDMFEISKKNHKKQNKKKQTRIRAAFKWSEKSKLYLTERFHKNKDTWRWMEIAFFAIF